MLSHHSKNEETDKKGNSNKQRPIEREQFWTKCSPLLLYLNDVKSVNWIERKHKQPIPMRWSAFRTGCLHEKASRLMTTATALEYEIEKM